MTVHEAIRTEIHRFINERRDCAIISPGAVAAAVFAVFSPAPVDARIAWSAQEHLKNMARRELAARFDDDGEQSESYTEQGELFSGRLQERYPVPRKAGEEPQYKLREALTADEARWNIRSLRRSGSARLAHADHLEAWHENRPEAA